jgi:hypothetical protein
LYIRNRGEAIENLTGAGEYHWMAGNFLKYGAEEATFGSRTAGDIPVDAHELIALCAPRPTFISYGVPEKCDARWLDRPQDAATAPRRIGAAHCRLVISCREVGPARIHRRSTFDSMVRTR